MTLSDWRFSKAPREPFRDGIPLPVLCISVPGSLGAVWRTAGGWMAAGDVVTTSDYYTDPKNQEEVDGYTVVNLRTGYETERFDLVLFCDNLFNKGYAENRWQWLGSLIQEGASRKIGITATVRL